MVALLEVLNPEASLRLVKACLFHDVAERWVGDMPAPGKWRICQDVCANLKAAEEGILKDLLVDYESGLDSTERKWLKAMDLLELYTYCRQELAMGNTNVQQTSTTVRQILGEEWVPAPVKDWLVEPGARTDDFFGHTL